MENNGNIYQLKGKALLLSNSHHSLETPITVSKNDNNSSFVNHALTLSTERGQKYVGSQWHSWPEELGEPAIRYIGGFWTFPPLKMTLLTFCSRGHCGQLVLGFNNISLVG
jgi:hypothetical protein